MADEKFTGYQLQIRKDCRIGIVAVEHLASLGDTKLDIAALAAINGWRRHMSKTRCIGCDRLLGNGKVGGFAVLMPMPLTEENIENAVSAGICRRCIARPHGELRRLFGQAIERDHIATVFSEEVSP